MPDWQQAYLSLFEVLGKKIKREQVLAPFTSFRVGGPARFFIEADNGIPMLSRDGRFAVKAASRIYRGILSEIEKRDYNPFLGRVFVAQSRKFAILLQEFLRTNLFPRRQTSPVFPQPVAGGAKHS
ncbi:MAG: hypothetical protein ONA69_09605 [candidate division KSB1 bacterium]|nr:hypothetical protein [candidate division KSB1 bacterium]